MPEHEREARQIALLADYERTLVADPVATPPPDLDPGLAMVARLLDRELGGLPPARAATPDAAFKVTLRHRLAEQAAAQAHPAAPPTLPVTRTPGVVYRNRHILPTPTLPASTALPNGKVGGRRVAAPPRTTPETDTTARPRPLRAAFGTAAGWLGAAFVILIVILAATLLLRGLPHATPAVQPNTTPSPVQVPTAPAPTSALNTATPRPVGPSWGSAADMGTPRTNHTATLLPDGRVLVTGGLLTPIFKTSDILASTEIYDPATDRWSPAASMGTPRWGHTATLLKDGRVLVAGGYPESVESGSLESVEIYDPATDRWSSAASMRDGRTDHTATLLSDGRVLVTGGYNYHRSGAVTSAEVYDPAADRWTATADAVANGAGQTATLLPDGTVLLTGSGDQAASPSARFNPTTNSWTTASSLTPGRAGHGAALLPNGQVLVVGGAAPNQAEPFGAADRNGFTSAQRYDPAADRWLPAASLAMPRTLPELVTLASGQILAIGGSIGTDAKGVTVTAERYDPATDRWIVVGVLSGRYGHTATRLADGRVLVTGGTGEDRSALATTLLYTDGPVSSATPAPGATPSPAAPLWQPAGALATVRAQHTATRLSDGRILVAGGYTAGGEGVTAAAELYDPQTRTWSPTGEMNVPRVGHKAILLPDGRVLAVGGFNYRQYNNTTKAEGAELYDPATGRWLPAAPLTVGFTPRALVLLADGRVLAVSGPDSTVGNKTTVTIYDPAADQWTVAGNPDLPDIAAAVTLRDGSVLLIGEIGQENDGTTPVRRFDPLTSQWTTVAPLQGARGGYTANLLPDGRVLVAGGVSLHQGSGAEILDTTALFDPVSNSWSDGPALARARANHTAVTLADGRILVVGGENGGWVAQAEIYDPQSGRWSSAGALDPARGHFAVAPLADGRAIVTGGDAGFVRSEWLARVELFIPPARQAVPSASPPVTLIPTTPPGTIDWNSPSAGLHGYRLGTGTLPDGTAPAIGQQIGTTVLRLQSGGVFPVGTPIYSVAGQSPDEWLALKDGDRVLAYQRNDSMTTLLRGVQVVVGTVADAGTAVCPAYGCPKSPDQQEIGTVATAYRVTVDRSLQGSLTPGQSIEVREMGISIATALGNRFVQLHQGDIVIFFLIPAQQESIGDFSAGDYYWMMPGWVHGLSGEQVMPIGVTPDDGPVPLAQFEAAVADLFRNVTPLAPTDPRPTPLPVPTATGIVPAPTALPVATPTPTPRP